MPDNGAVKTIVNTDPSAFAHTLSAAPALLERSREQWLKRFHLRKPLKATATVWFAGTGSSWHVALWAADLYQRAGINTRVVPSFDLATKQGPAPARGDLLFLVSHRGHRSLTAKAARACRHARVILVSSEGAAHGGFELLEVSPAEVSKAHSRSLLGAMAALSVALGEMKPKLAAPLATQRKKTAALLRKTLGRATAAAALPSRSGAWHLAGTGPFLAAALETRLKTMEIARRPAQVYHLEEFLHGPVAAVEKKDLLWVLGDVSAPHGKAMAALGARCQKAVGVAAGLTAPWQALLALAEGFKATLALARREGFDPDSNRMENPRYAKAFRACASQ